MGSDQAPRVNNRAPNKFGSLPLRVARRAARGLGAIGYRLLTWIPAMHFLEGYRGKQAPITVRVWFMQRVLGFNRKAYWGVHPTSKVVQPQNIIIGKNSNPGIEPGCYIQGLGEVLVGDYTQVAANTAIISANHDVYDLDVTVPGRVEIGSYCWIGTHCVILPNVTLGDFTIVGAGAVVTRSFPEGYCVIAGNPARKIRSLDPSKCTRREDPEAYVGYLRSTDFAAYRKDHLWR